MSRVSYAIAAIVLTVTLAGCGGATPEDGHVEFNAPPPSDAIKGFTENMSKDMKDKTYLKKPKEPEKQSRACNAGREVGIIDLKCSLECHNRS